MKQVGRLNFQLSVCIVSFVPPLAILQHTTEQKDTKSLIETDEAFLVRKIILIQMHLYTVDNTFLFLQSTYRDCLVQ